MSKGRFLRTLELLCLSVSFLPSGPGSPGPPECLSASLHHSLVDVHLSHAVLLSCHIVSTSTSWLFLLDGFSTHSPSLPCTLPAPTTPVSPAYSSPRSPRNHLESTGGGDGGEALDKRITAMNGSSRKWPRWEKSEVWSRQRLPASCRASCSGEQYTHFLTLPGE